MPRATDPAVPTPNVPLLRKTLEYIEAHPEDWNQSVWRAHSPSCGTVACFAGTAVWLDGAPFGDSVAEDAETGMILADEVIGPDGRTRLIEFYAQEILGLTPDEAFTLFEGSNGLDDLRDMVDYLCGDAR